MDVILIFAGIAVVLFVSSYMHKRRFGLLGLALATGSLLSGIWGYDLGLIASGLGVPSGPWTTAIILSLLILLIIIVNETKCKIARFTKCKKFFMSCQT